VSQVANVRTPSDWDTVVEALVSAGVPTVNATRMLAAQSALETAGWTAMHNWNLGNITASNTTTQSWVQQTTTGEAASLHFLAFDSLDEGASYFFHWLDSHGLLTYANAGNLDGYVARLAQINYAGSADYNAYKRGMATWINKYGGHIVPAKSLSIPPMATIVGLSIVALGAVAYAYDKGYFDAGPARGRIRRV